MLDKSHQRKVQTNFMRAKKMALITGIELTTSCTTRECLNNFKANLMAQKTTHTVVTVYLFLLKEKCSVNIHYAYYVISKMRIKNLEQIV